MDIQKDYIREMYLKNGKISYLKTCVRCGNNFKTNRVSKLTCCSNCKQAHYLRTKKGLQPLANAKGIKKAGS